MPSEASPRRPLIDADQYAALLAAAEDLPPLFRVALVLARESGHRIGAIRLLRWGDVDLIAGRVTWRAESDKIGYEHRTPLTSPAIEVLRSAHALAQLVEERPPIAEAWIVAGDDGEPISRHALNGWWRRAAKAANRPARERLGWHSLRRQFATELKATPLRDLAELGGWKSTKTLPECYQQPDHETMRAALEQRRPVRVSRTEQSSP